MTAVVERDGDQALVLTALRENPSGAWAKPDCQSAQYLLPHMERANAIQQKLGILQAGEILLNSIELGVVFLTAGGKAIFTNHAAETIFRSADGLMLRSGALGATEIAANASLENAVRQAVSLNFSNAVSVERKSMRRHYQVVVAPLRRRFAQFAGSPAPAAVALITDPEQQHHADPELLKKLFDLTPKRRRLRRSCARGEPWSRQLASSVCSTRLSVHIYAGFSARRERPGKPNWSSCWESSPDTPLRCNAARILNLAC
jgi:hypothetical protein